MMIPQFIGAAHDYGLELHVFYADSIEDMNEYIDMGIDGILTNYPARLKDLLEAGAGN